MTRSGRILVVDDDVNANSALVESLREEGFEVESAADAFKALGCREAFSPHVVVTDLKLPGMDGVELMKRLHSSETPPAVIVMTAPGAVQSAVDALRAGAAGYVAKPAHVDELVIVIERVLERIALEQEVRRLYDQMRAMPPIPGSRLDEIERYAILETLKATGGSTSKAAERLGISVRTIQYRLHDYNAAPRSQMTAIGSSGTSK